MTQSPTRYTFILIHGAWQGAWAWETIVPRLRAAGHDAVAVDLPGNGFDLTPPHEVTLDLYAAHVSRIVDAVRGPVVLVGHSMGGTVASQTSEFAPAPDRAGDLSVRVSAAERHVGAGILRQVSAAGDARRVFAGHV